MISDDRWKLDEQICDRFGEAFAALLAQFGAALVEQGPVQDAPALEAQEAHDAAFTEVVRLEDVMGQARRQFERFHREGRSAAAKHLHGAIQLAWDLYSQFTEGETALVGVMAVGPDREAVLADRAEYLRYGAGLLSLARETIEAALADAALVVEDDESVGGTNESTVDDPAVESIFQTCPWCGATLYSGDEVEIGVPKEGPCGCSLHALCVDEWVEQGRPAFDCWHKQQFFAPDGTLTTRADAIAVRGRAHAKTQEVKRVIAEALRQFDLYYLNGNSEATEYLREEVERALAVAKEFAVAEKALLIANKDDPDAEARLAERTTQMRTQLASLEDAICRVEEAIVVAARLGAQGSSDESVSWDEAGTAEDDAPPVDDEEGVGGTDHTTVDDPAADNIFDTCPWCGATISGDYYDVMDGDVACGCLIHVVCFNEWDAGGRAPFDCWHKQSRWTTTGLLRVDD